MERSQLLYMLTVAECGSVTRAAQKLHLAQPSLSNQIIHLEEELGVALFDRSNKQMLLTDAGRTFAANAKRILNDIHRLSETMQDYAQSTRGRIRIGALPIMCALHIPEMVQAYRSCYPNVEIYLIETGSDGLRLALEENTIDVAFMIVNPAQLPSNDVHCVPLMHDNVCAALHIDDPRAARPAINLQDLAGSALILPDQTFNLSRIICSHLDSMGVPYEVRTICSQIDSCLSIVDSNMGVSFCSRMAAEHYGYPNVAVVPLEPPITRRIVMNYRKDISMYPALREFLQFSQRYLGSGSEDEMKGKNTF